MQIPEKPPQQFKALVDNTLSEKEIQPYWHAVEEINRRCLPWSDARQEGRLKKWNTPDAALLWNMVRFSRMGNTRYLPLNSKEGSAFRYWMPDPVLEGLHHVDQYTSGAIATGESKGFPSAQTYLMKSIIEEAIASSQLEGAATTRKVAKEMIKNRRSARTYGEKMILNNYRTILQIKENLEAHPEQELTIDLLHKLHRTTTEGTLQDNSDAGRFRSSDDIVVVDRATSQPLHYPPSYKDLEERMQAVLDFANEKTGEGFIHPVLRGIILHFMIGYEHPYVDGNGRIARALFYWYMLRRGFWVTEYLAISRAILDSPAKYKMAYLNSEIEDGDITYFAVYHLGIIELAIKKFTAFLEKKRKEVATAVTHLRGMPELNNRQVVLIDHALRQGGDMYTINGHATENSVTRVTARKDLYGLVDMKLMTATKRGREVIFQTVDDLYERITKAQIDK